MDIEKLLTTALENPEQVPELIDTLASSIKPVVAKIVDVFADWMYETSDDEASKKIAKAQYNTFKNYTDAGFTRDEAIAIMTNNANALKSGASSLGKNKGE